MDQPIQQLARFIGEWECEETYHAGGWTPNEIKSVSASDHIQWGPGDNSILTDYHSDSALGHYVAHSVIAWDPNQNVFRCIFLDSFGSFQDQSGGIDGDVVTFSSDEMFNDRPGTLRRIYTFRDNTQHLSVDFVDAAGQVTPLVTIDKRLKE